MTLSNNIYYYI